MTQPSEMNRGIVLANLLPGQYHFSENGDITINVSNKPLNSNVFTTIFDDISIFDERPTLSHDNSGNTILINDGTLVTNVTNSGIIILSNDGTIITNNVDISGNSNIVFRSNMFIIGGKENDRLYGGDDNDFLFGADGADKLYGDVGNDTLYGGQGDDFIFGGDGNDTLYGENGLDKLYGGDGNDVLYSGLGRGYLFGEGGNDTLIGSGADRYYGGGDADIFVFENLSSYTGTYGNIYDYSESDGDKIDISDLLVGFDSLTDDINDFVWFTEYKGDALLRVDADGTNDTISQTIVARLHNETTYNDLNDVQVLINNGALIV